MISLSLPGLTRQSIETIETNETLAQLGRGSPDQVRGLRSNADAFELASYFLVLRRPGGSSEEHEPDPIPNSAVKLLSANGTMA